MPYGVSFSCADPIMASGTSSACERIRLMSGVQGDLENGGFVEVGGSGSGLGYRVWDLGRRF